MQVVSLVDGVKMIKDEFAKIVRSDKMSFVAKLLYLCNNIVKFDEQERHPALPKGNLI